MYDRILLPTDGSGPATAALEYGARVAERFDASVHVLHVAERVPGRDEAEAENRRDSERSSDEVLESARDWVDVEGVPASDEVVTGDPIDVIPSYAAEEGFDLIVMGTHGRTGIGRYVLGSVTEAVVRTADVPVVVVRGTDEVRTALPYETIVVPTDGSEHAAVALDRGIELAARSDATLHALSVVDVSPIGLDPEVDLRVDRLEAGAQRVVDDARARAEDRGVDVVTSTSFGSIHRGIASYAQEQDADLLVMGTHGRSGLDRFLLGSVTERVLRTAPTPVLTVRADE